MAEAGAQRQPEPSANIKAVAADLRAVYKTLRDLLRLLAVARAAWPTRASGEVSPAFATPPAWALQRGSRPPAAPLAAREQPD